MLQVMEHTGNRIIDFVLITLIAILMRRKRPTWQARFLALVSAIAGMSLLGFPNFFSFRSQLPYASANRPVLQKRGEAEKKWLAISRHTQVVMLAVVFDGMVNLHITIITWYASFTKVWKGSWFL